MTTPPEDLIIATRKLDPRVIETIRNPVWDPATNDWRDHVSPSLRRLWRQLGSEERLTAFLVATERANERRVEE